MTREEFMAEVFRPSTLDGRCGALLALADARHAQIERIADAARRRAQHREHLLELLDHLDRLQSAPLPPDRGSEPDLTMQRMSLINAGLARWNHLLARLRYVNRARVHRRVHTDFGLRAGPWRDVDHGDLTLVEIDATSQPADSGCRHGREAVLPFIAPRRRAAARAALYKHWLMPARLERRHLRAPHETPLLGQWGVFAARPIASGTCLGAFGGLLLDPVDGFLLRDHRHAISASREPGRVTLNGENVLSLVNTLFEVDAKGVWTGHPATGYNCEMAHFPARLAHGWDVVVVACFASQDIDAGAELRWNYHLGAFPNPIQWQG